MPQKKYILSTCGTSILTYKASKEEKDIVYKYANNKKPPKDQPEDYEYIQSIITKAQQALENATPTQAQAHSAELNTIVKINESQPPISGDFYYLLSTDTWLGEVTAELISAWLKKQYPSASVVVERHTDLQTQDIDAFQLSLSELIRAFESFLPNYANNGYKIIFNLTGGFKAIQGFLQSIANFYADETFYIFERSSAMMQIPRLPIKMDEMSEIEENIDFFRKLETETLVTLAEKPNSVSEFMLFCVDDEINLSAWGELVWHRSKKQLYRKKLLKSPNLEKIRYSDAFVKTAEQLSVDRLCLVNERIDQLNKHLHDKSYNPPSLDFKALKGKPFPKITHEMDAWSDQDAKRMFGYFEDSHFVIDKLDKGLH